MTFYLIISLIVTIITKKITAITSEGNFEALSEPIPYDSPKPVPMTAADLGDVNVDNENEMNNSTESFTSQDRISYHHKKSHYPHRFSHHHHPHLHLPHSHHHHHHRLPAYYKPPRKKYRRGRKKPPVLRMPYVKMPFKSRKPILLSEVLRNGGRLPYTRIKPSGPVIKDYIEEEDLETSPFSPIDNIEYPSPFSKIRPQSFEIAEDNPDVLPVQPIEEEIIYPGVPNVKPYSSMIKRPPSIWSLSKPPDSYYDSDGSADSTRDVRYPNKPLYLDKDIASLLQKIKLEGLNGDSQPSSTEAITQVQNRDNITDLNAAISKLLFPFLSDTAIKQIQLYFKSLPSHKGDNTENQFKDNSKNTTYPSNQYSVTESVKEDDSDNSTYFIMVKSPSYKGLNITKLLTQQFNQQRWQSDNQTERTKLEIATNTTTPASKESLALQKYIMMMAGITKDAANNENYLPRFNTFQNPNQKQARHL